MKKKATAKHQCGFCEERPTFKSSNLYLSHLFSCPGYSANPPKHDRSSLEMATHLDEPDDHFMTMEMKMAYGEVERELLRLLEYFEEFPPAKRCADAKGITDRLLAFRQKRKELPQYHYLKDHEGHGVADDLRREREAEKAAAPNGAAECAHEFLWSNYSKRQWCKLCGAGKAVKV